MNNCVENCTLCVYSDKQYLDGIGHCLYCTKSTSNDGTPRLICCSDTEDFDSCASVPLWCPMLNSPVNQVKKDLEEICREQNGIPTVNSNSVNKNSVNQNCGNPRTKSSFEEFIEKGAKAVETGVNKVVNTISESLGGSTQNNQNTWGNPANNNPIFAYGVAQSGINKRPQVIKVDKTHKKPDISENELWNVFRERGMSAIRDYVMGAYELGLRDGEMSASKVVSADEYNRGFADGLKAGGFYNPLGTPVPPVNPVIPEEPAPYEPARDIPVEVYGVFNGEPFNPAKQTPVKVYGVPETMRKRTPKSPDVAGEVTLAYGVYLGGDLGSSVTPSDFTTTSSSSSDGISLGKDGIKKPPKNLGK